MATGPGEHENQHNVEALQQYASCLESIIEHVASGVLLMSSEGTFTYANTAAQRMLGVTRDELIGKSFHDPHWQLFTLDGQPIPFDDRPIQCCMRAGMPIREMQILLCCPNGIRVTVSVDVAPLTDGESKGFIISLTDITERVTTERTLRESEKRFRTMVETFPGMVWMTRPEPPYLPMYLSRHFEDIYGYSRDALLEGRVFLSDIVHPDDMARARAAFDSALTERRPYSIELRYRKPDGATTWVLEIGAGVYDDENNLRYLLGTVFDITERKKIEVALRESEERFRTIVELFPGFIWMTTPDPPFYPQYLSPQLEAHFGYPLEEFLEGKRSLDDLLSAEDALRLRQAAREAIANHASYSLEMQMRKADGGLVRIYSIGTAIYDEQGQAKYLLGSALDITERKQAEEELRRMYAELDERVRQRTSDLEMERRRLRAVLDALPVGVVLLDADGVFLECNDHFRDIWGGTAEDKVPIAATPDDYYLFCGWWADTQKQITPDDWASQRALHAGETITGEIIDILRFDGVCGTILNSAAPIRGTNGQIIGAVVTIQDITAERQLERQARASTATLYTMFDQVPAGVALFDDQFICRQINATYAAYAHSTIGEMIGRPLIELLQQYFAMRTANFLYARFQHCWRTGRPYAAREAMMTLDTHPDEIRYVDWSLRRVSSAEGMALGVLVTVMDVTEHTLARQQIEFERARWLTSLMTIPLGVLFITPDHIIQVANAPAERLWGKQLSQRNWQDMVGDVLLVSPITGAAYPAEERPIARAMRGDSVHDFEALLLCPDGLRIPVLISATPVRLDEKVVGVVQVTQDLSRLKEADRVKDEFLATVTHDLRSPLAAIKGWAEFGLETDDPDLIREGLHAILRSVSVQRALVEDLLDASALQAGSLRLQPETQDIRPIIGDVYSTFEPIAREQGLQLLYEIPPTPMVARFDTVRIQQIVGNLVSNAVKYTPAGGSVTLTLARRDEQLVLTVRDTGIGIAAEVLPHVFERFYRVESAGEQTKSLGLGLAIVKALVELHGGTVTADSPGPEQGAIFTIVLPAED